MQIELIGNYDTLLLFNYSYLLKNPEKVNFFSKFRNAYIFFVVVSHYLQYFGLFLYRLTCVVKLIHVNRTEYSAK